MHDIKKLLADPEKSKAGLLAREPGLDVDAVFDLAGKRKEAVKSFDALRAQQRELSQAFKKGGGGSPEDLAESRAALKALSNDVKALEHERKALDEQLQHMLLMLPNLPADDVPVGRDETANEIMKTWGEPREFTDFEPKEHHAIGEDLGVLDFEAASKISGHGFAVYRDLGARLERALWNFFIDTHVDVHGYREVLPPFLVRREAMEGTSQLPKFEDDAFKTQDDLFLIPTAEVPITNIHREEMLSLEQLPIKYTGFSACFRREAGSYGRMVKGLTRVHQFHKVELVQFTEPEHSEDAHEALTSHAEAILELLELPYRRLKLCTGDLGFGAAKCFDLEVWLPGQKSWREISSCSNFYDFQARRANIRYKPEAGAKPRYVHTLNGSGLAVGRTIVALLENGQRADGGVDLPEVLWPYMRVKSLEPLS